MAFEAGLCKASQLLPGPEDGELNHGQMRHGSKLDS